MTLITHKTIEFQYMNVIQHSNHNVKIVVWLWTQEATPYLATVSYGVLWHFFGQINQEILKVQD